MTPLAFSDARCTQPDVLPSRLPCGPLVRCSRYTSRAGGAGIGVVSAPRASCGSAAPHSAFHSLRIDGDLYSSAGPSACHQELADVETDAARADDGHASCRPACP